MRDVAPFEAFDISLSMNHSFRFLAERRSRRVTLQFRNQCLFVSMRHHCMHQSSKMLSPTIFLVLLRFFMWYTLKSQTYFECYRLLVCNRFPRALALNLPNTFEINLWWQTWQ